MQFRRRWMVLPVLLWLMAGCAHYNRASVTALANKNLNASDVTAGMCSDFAQASQDFQQGPDSALPLIGKASDIKSLSELTAKQGIDCREAVKRGGDLPQRALPGFKSTWQEILKIIGG